MGGGIEFFGPFPDFSTIIFFLGTGEIRLEIQSAIDEKNFKNGEKNPETPADFGLVLSSVFASRGGAARGARTWRLVIYYFR